MERIEYFDAIGEKLDKYESALADRGVEANFRIEGAVLVASLNETSLLDVEQVDSVTRSLVNFIHNKTDGVDSVHLYNSGVLIAKGQYIRDGEINVTLIK